MLLALSENNPVPLIIVMLLGFLVGTAGHVYKSKTTVATGIALIFLATIVLPAIIFFGQD